MPYVEEDQQAQGPPPSFEGEPRQAPQHGPLTTADSTSGRFIRSRRVNEPLANGIAAAAGLFTFSAGAQPTGWIFADGILVVFAAATVVWAAASAPRWAAAGACGIAAMVAMQPIVAAVAALGFFAGLDIRSWHRDRSIIRSVVGGVAVNTLIRSDLDGFFGLSSLVGILVCLILFALGLHGRPRRIRTAGWILVALFAASGVLAAVSVGVAAVGARPSVTNGAQSAREAVSALNDGDYERAADLFDQASVAFDESGSRLGGTLAAPGRFIPGVAQNLEAGADLSVAAASATAEAAGALRQVDVSQLTVSGGAIDLAAIRAVEAPLQRVKVAFDQLRVSVAEADSPWLLDVIGDELDDLDDEFARNEPRLRNAIDAVRLAPQMLGDQRARRYLLLFTTPAEARGLGGLASSFAVLEIRNGQMEVVDFGRASELSVPDADANCRACPSELLARYGRFGFNSAPDGGVSSSVWSNITMPAHFPYVAEAASILYPQARGRQVDGVAVIDPYVVQTLMEYAGPIPVRELDTVVSPDNAAKFILEDQYILAEGEGVSVDALDSLGAGVILAILSGALPDPPTVAADLGPLISERRLLMWTDDAEEQDLLDRVGLLGSMPLLDNTDGGFAVSVSNMTANKIDVFLNVEADVSLIERDGGRQLVADVIIRNDAPGSGLPDSVIGNSIGIPRGSSRLFVTFYGPPNRIDTTLDGAEFLLEPFPEAGWIAYSNFIDIGPEEERVFHLVFDLPPLATGDFAPTLWEQPLANRR